MRVLFTICWSSYQISISFKKPVTRLQTFQLIPEPFLTTINIFRNIRQWNSLCFVWLPSWQFSPSKYPDSSMVFLFERFPLFTIWDLVCAFLLSYSYFISVSWLRNEESLKSFTLTKLSLIWSLRLSKPSTSTRYTITMNYLLLVLQGLSSTLSFVNLRIRYSSGCFEPLQSTQSPNFQTQYHNPSWASFFQVLQFAKRLICGGDLLEVETGKLEFSFETHKQLIRIARRLLCGADSE